MFALWGKLREYEERKTDDQGFGRPCESNWGRFVPGEADEVDETEI